MRHIQQSNDKTCGIACVAMVAGVGFATVLELLPEATEHGVGSEALDKLLDAIGVTYNRQQYPTLLPNSRYIVTVASLNMPGGMHFIALQTGDEDVESGTVECVVYDPQYGRNNAFYYGHDNGMPLTSWAEAVRIY